MRFNFIRCVLYILPVVQYEILMPAVWVLMYVCTYVVLAAPTRMGSRDSAAKILKKDANS